MESSGRAADLLISPSRIKLLNSLNAEQSWFVFDVREGAAVFAAGSDSFRIGSTVADEIEGHREK